MRRTLPPCPANRISNSKTEIFRGNLQYLEYFPFDYPARRIVHIAFTSSFQFNFCTNTLILFVGLQRPSSRRQPRGATGAVQHRISIHRIQWATSHRHMLHHILAPIRITHDNHRRAVVFNNKKQMSELELAGGQPNVFESPPQPQTQHNITQNTQHIWWIEVPLPSPRRVVFSLFCKPASTRSQAWKFIPKKKMIERNPCKYKTSKYIPCNYIYVRSTKLYSCMN